MCDKAAFDAMDGRMDDFEKRLVVVEAKQDSLQQQVAAGFADVKAYIASTIAQDNANRAEWGKFARLWLGRIFAALLCIAVIACGAQAALKFIV